jgi:2-polyprenyl-3-methyl-5-hydroxy-6-metoxy-1,4-benzoquinol methylase
MPPLRKQYGEHDYYHEYRREFFSASGIPQNRGYMGSRLPPLLVGGFDHLHGARRLLQIGAGTGQMTSQLLAWGWDVTCCEAGAWACEYLRNLYTPITVYQADWMEWEPPRLYDAITANHVLEHFPDAPAALEKMVATLVPGGKLYIDVPAQLFDDGTSNESAWPGDLHSREHIWHFSERTLRVWFENLGLVDIQFANTVRAYEAGKLMDYHVVGRKPG